MAASTAPVSFDCIIPAVASASGSAFMAARLVGGESAGVSQNGCTYEVP